MSLLEFRRGEDPATGIQGQGLSDLSPAAVNERLVHVSEMGGHVYDNRHANSGTNCTVSLVKCENWAANVLRAELHHFLYNLDHQAFTDEIEQRRLTFEQEFVNICPISPTDSD